MAEKSKAKDSSKQDLTFLGDGDDKEASTTATVTDVRTFCEHIVMYAIWHIRPHSPLPVPSFQPSRRSPHLSLDWPGLLCLCPCCCSICTCLGQVILARAPFEPSDTIVIHLLDATQVTSIDSSLKYGCWTWPLQFSCHWRLILQRDSFWRAVGRQWRTFNNGRNCRSCCRGAVEPDIYPGAPAVIRVCWTIRDIGTCLLYTSDAADE